LDESYAVRGLQCVFLKFFEIAADHSLNDKIFYRIYMAGRLHSFYLQCLTVNELIVRERVEIIPLRTVEFV